MPDQVSRRGFFGFVGKLVAVGAAMSVPIAILKPLTGRLILVDASAGPTYSTLDGTQKCLPQRCREGSHNVL